MENKKWKRFGSCLMALAMVLSGTALPASAATPGKDGSAEMNEAYAAHESLMPIGPSFSVATLLEWTPESDPDARYSRASIPMANREGGFVVNPKANPEAKLMLCSLANSSHDTTSSQGTENFMSWSFNYWQYTDSFVYWSGSEEGLICCPTGEFTDAAHTNVCRSLLHWASLGDLARAMRRKLTLSAKRRKMAVSPWQISYWK